MLDEFSGDAMLADVPHLRERGAFMAIDLESEVRSQLSAGQAAVSPANTATIT